MAIDPVDNPFSALGLEPSFDIDPRRVRAAWMQKAAREHPDVVGVGGQSTCANDALRQLSDPLSRAEALLRVHQAPAVDERTMPEGFLLEMMELRERADEAGRDPDAAAQLLAEASERRNRALARIGDAFRSARGGALEAGHALEIRSQMNVVRSFDRMLEHLAREREDR